MNILIALDGSANAEACLKDLVYFPLTEGVRVHTVVVCDETILAPHRMDQRAGGLIIEKAKHNINTLYPGISLSSELRSGPAPSQILQVSESFKADIILAGAHAPRPFPREFLGSVAAQLAKHADCSIRLLRQHSPQNRVIACLENTDIDLSVLQALREMQWPPGSQLMFLHVLDAPPVEFSQNPREDARLFYQLQSKAQDKMEASIKIYIDELNQMFPQLETEILVSPELEPVPIILETARTWSATTIVVGSHRRKGQEKFWLGNVSEPVAARAHCSVHIVRHALQP
jgi:nucleotide-binding universal stress UspA family protein